jgi:glycine/D-amino acid oxidase-like deaminating enzyme
MEEGSGRRDSRCYAVVGGGALGASTALALQQQFPNARVILFQGTHLHTASTDINKIIRAAYPVPEYVWLGKEAMEKWKSHSLYSPFYRYTGWVQCRDGGNNHNTHQEQDDKRISQDEYLLRTGSQEKPILDNEEELWVNEDIGLFASATALGAVINMAKKMGVTVRKQNVSELIIDKTDGTCRGVVVEGEDIVADETIVAAGAWTPSLLEKSNVQLFPDENRRRDFFQVTAVAVATLPLTAEEFARFQRTPIVVTNKGMVQLTPNFDFY